MSDVHATLRAVTRRYPGASPVDALGPIDLALQRGEFFSVVGPSGCGKSTLLDVLCGLARPSSGSVTFEGRELDGAVPDGLGVVFQEDATFPWLNVRKNVAFGLQHGRGAGQRLKPGEIDQLVDHAIGFMGAGAICKVFSGAAFRRHAPACVHRPHAGAAAAPNFAR